MSSEGQCTTLVRGLRYALVLALAAGSACEGGTSSWAADKKAKDGDTTLRVAATSLQPRRIERHYSTSGTLRARHHGWLGSARWYLSARAAVIDYSRLAFPGPM